MNTILLTLGSLTLGGSAAILLLALAGRSIRGRYGAKWRCWGWLLLCLRLALPFPLLPYIRTGAPIRVDIPNPPAVTQPSTIPNPPNNPNVPGTGNASASQGAAQGNPDPPVSSGGIPSPAPLTTERELDPARVALSLWLLGPARACGS